MEEKKLRLLEKAGFSEGISAFTKEGYELRKAQIDRMSLSDLKIFLKALKPIIPQ